MTVRRHDGEASGDMARHTRLLPVFRDNHFRTMPVYWVGSEIKLAISKSTQKVLSTCPYEEAGKSTLTH